MNLFALVKASPVCVAMLGTDPVRFFEFGEAPELQGLPYATHQHITGTPYSLLDGPASADRISTQIDVWATTGAECRAITNAIRSAIEGHCYITSWLGTNKEADVFRCTFTIQYIELR